MLRLEADENLTEEFTAVEVVAVTDRGVGNREHFAAVHQRRILVEDVGDAEDEAEVAVIPAHRCGVLEPLVSEADVAAEHAVTHHDAVGNAASDRTAAGAGVTDLAAGREPVRTVTEGIGEDFLPANVDFSIIDHFEKVTDKDAAVMTRRIR
mgnify:CR=1 FL=1